VLRVRVDDVQLILRLMKRQQWHQCCQRLVIHWMNHKTLIRHRQAQHN